MASPAEVRAQVAVVIQQENETAAHAVHAGETIGKLTVAKIVGALQTAAEVTRGEMEANGDAKGAVKGLGDKIKEGVRPPMEILKQGAESPLIASADAGIGAQERATEAGISTLDVRHEMLSGYLSLIGGVIDQIEQDNDQPKQAATENTEAVRQRTPQINQDLQAYADQL